MQESQEGMKREESVKGRGVEKKGEKYTRETGMGGEKRGPRGGEERSEGITEVEDAGEVEEGCKEGGWGLEDWEELGCHSAPMVGGSCPEQGEDGQGCRMGMRGCTGKPGGLSTSKGGG